MLHPDRNKVTVAVGGFPCAGKSQVIGIIRRAFEDHGIEIVITGNDSPIPAADFAAEKLKDRGVEITVHECYGPRLDVQAYRPARDVPDSERIPSWSAYANYRVVRSVGPYAAGGLIRCRYHFARKIIETADGIQIPADAVERIEPVTAE